MDSRLQRRRPEADTGGEIKLVTSNAVATHDHDPRQNRYRDAEREDVQRLGIKDRDHDDRADVICNCKREQEYLRAKWHPAPQQREDAEGEGNICRHRNAPAVSSFSTS